MEKHPQKTPSTSPKYASGTSQTKTKHVKTQPPKKPQNPMKCPELQKLGSSASFIKQAVEWEKNKAN